MKIKVFLWYLKKGVILTKDNLVRRNWNGDKKCCFCHSPESIQHLFLDCAYAKLLWRAVHMLLTAASTLCWAIWITRNEVVFDKYRPKSFLQVLFRGTHWLREWARLQQRDDLREQLTLVGQHLETLAL
jgi:hypothetical protein